MSYSRRDMQADDRAAANRAGRLITNVPTSSADIDAAMLGVIKACRAEDRPIEVADFRRALVPAAEIEPRFKRLLAIAKQQRRAHP